MVRLDRISIVVIAASQGSFTFQISVLVELSEAHFVGAEWATHFEKGAKEEDLSAVSNTSVLKALLRPPLSDSCSVRRKTTPDVLSQLLRYQKLVSKSS